MWEIMIITSITVISIWYRRVISQFPELLHNYGIKIKDYWYLRNLRNQPDLKRILSQVENKLNHEFSDL